MMSRLLNDINDNEREQLNKLHEEMLQDIIKKMKVEKRQGLHLKRAIYLMAKEKNPEMRGIGLAKEMKKLVKKKILGSIDLEKAGKEAEAFWAQKRERRRQRRQQRQKKKHVQNQAVYIADLGDDYYNQYDAYGNMLQSQGVHAGYRDLIGNGYVDGYGYGVNNHDVIQSVYIALIPVFVTIFVCCMFAICCGVVTVLGYWFKNMMETANVNDRGCEKRRVHLSDVSAM
eukprot:177976_1